MSRTDQPPGKLLRWFFRAPIYLYKAGLGRLMSKRLLMLTHTGRKSGQPRFAVLEVARHDAATGTFLVPAAYGRQADWYRNLLATPAARINHRGREYEVNAETLALEAAAAEFRLYAVTYPKAARNLGKVMELPFDDPQGLAEKVPLVALRLR